MDDKRLEILIENDKEWRRHILSEQKEIRNDLQKLDKRFMGFKTKIFIFVSVFSSSFGVAGHKILEFFK